MAKVTVQIEGKAVEAELPAGVVAIPQTELNEKFIPKETVERRDAEFARMRKQLETAKDPDQLLEDEEFRKKAEEKWGFKGKGKEADAEAVQKVRKQIEDQEIKPRQTRIEELEGKAQKTLLRQLNTDLRQALAKAGVKPGLINGAAKELEDRFGYDDEADEWSEYDERNETFVLNPRGNRDRPHKGVEDVVTEWAANADNADYLVDQRQRGAGYQGVAGTGKGGKDVTLTAEEAQDHQTYKAAQTKAKEQGGRVIVESPTS